MRWPKDVRMGMHCSRMSQRLAGIGQRRSDPHRRSSPSLLHRVTLLSRALCIQSTIKMLIGLNKGKRHQDICNHLGPCLKVRCIQAIIKMISLNNGTLRRDTCNRLGLHPKVQCIQATIKMIWLNNGMLHQDICNHLGLNQKVQCIQADIETSWMNGPCQ